MMRSNKFNNRKTGIVFAIPVLGFKLCSSLKYLSKNNKHKSLQHDKVLLELWQLHYPTFLCSLTPGILISSIITS